MRQIQKQTTKVVVNLHVPRRRRVRRRPVRIVATAPALPPVRIVERIFMGHSHPQPHPSAMSVPAPVAVPAPVSAGIPTQNTEAFGARAEEPTGLSTPPRTRREELLQELEPTPVPSPYVPELSGAVLNRLFKGAGMVQTRRIPIGRGKYRAETVSEKRLRASEANLV